MKIIKLESARHMDNNSWRVGEEIFSKMSEDAKYITEIKDMSNEFENGYHVQYDIYVNKKLYKSLINMPVKVEYES